MTTQDRAALVTLAQESRKAAGLLSDPAALAHALQTLSEAVEAALAALPSGGAEGPKHKPSCASLKWHACNGQGPCDCGAEGPTREQVEALFVHNIGVPNAHWDYLRRDDVLALYAEPAKESKS